MKRPRKPISGDHKVEVAKSRFLTGLSDRFGMTKCVGYELGDMLADTFWDMLGKCCGDALGHVLHSRIVTVDTAIFA